MIRMRKTQNYKGVQYDIVLVVENENTENEQIFCHIESKDQPRLKASYPLISRDWIGIIVNTETARINKQIDDLINPNSLEDICQKLGFETECIPYNK